MQHFLRKRRENNNNYKNSRTFVTEEFFFFFFFTLLLVLKSPTAANARRRERAAKSEATSRPFGSAFVATAPTTASFSGVSDQVQSGAFLKKQKQKENFSKRRYRAPPSCWTRFQKPPPKLATTLAKSHHARYGHANKNNKYSSSVFPKILSLKTKVSRNAVVVAVLAVLAFLNVSFTNRNTTTRTRH